MKQHFWVLIPTRILATRVRAVQEATFYSCLGHKKEQACIWPSSLGKIAAVKMLSKVPKACTASDQEAQASALL